MNRLSERLLHIAGQVRAGQTLADVGCDHGYLPIYLVQKGCMQRAIAMDINEGPLQRAMEHIEREALGDYIQTRQSDGLEKLSPGEADAVIIAGMGGNLTIDILTRGETVVRTLDQLILEPQSELAAVRAFLRENDYFIEVEDLVLEDGKYYPILRVLPKKSSDVQMFSEESGLPLAVLDAYGHRLLAEHHPVLLRFLKKERQQCEQILAGLPAEEEASERIAQRRAELMEKMERNRAAEAYMEI
ncbi:MAG: SAM-dependent methyltransferase [Eubacterium sp.]|nr:SAM-dependent methyltransferase [Eubacterium sp.]